MASPSQTEIDAISLATAGANRRIEREFEVYRAWHAEHAGKAIPMQAEWVKFEAVWVLRIGSSPFMAVPSTGRQNAASFAILDVRDRRDYVCHLQRSEVQSWLHRAQQSLCNP